MCDVGEACQPACAGGDSLDRFWRCALRSARWRFMRRTRRRWISVRLIFLLIEPPLLHVRGLMSGTDRAKHLTVSTVSEQARGTRAR